MNRLTRFVACTLMLIMVIVCSGCSSIAQKFEDEELRMHTETMIEALIADDFNSAYILFSDSCTEEEFLPAFDQMRKLLGNSDVYELKLLSINTNASILNGEQVNSKNAVYELTIENTKYITKVQSNSETLRLSAFLLTPYEYSEYYYTGTLQTMRGATSMQWATLLLNLLAIGFAVFAVIDCCRHNTKDKALWILISSFGFITGGVSLAAMSFRLNFSYGWIFAYSALIRYGSGTTIVRIMIPVGAIIYFITRKSRSNKVVSPTIICEGEPVMVRQNVGTEECSADEVMDP